MLADQLTRLRAYFGSFTHPLPEIQKQMIRLRLDFISYNMEWLEWRALFHEKYQDFSQDMPSFISRARRLLEYCNQPGLEYRAVIYVFEVVVRCSVLLWKDSPKGSDYKAALEELINDINVAEAQTWKMFIQMHTFQLLGYP